LALTSRWQPSSPDDPLDLFHTETFTLLLPFNILSKKGLIYPASAPEGLQFTSSSHGEDSQHITHAKTAINRSVLLGYHNNQNFLFNHGKYHG
ncbi:hypothetical protein Ancab_006410, partial [Ancistrocladus abbreviatus]